MSAIERPSMPATSTLHSRSRRPSTGCAKYAAASSSDESANVRAIMLWPSPVICGKMNHIQ